MWIETEDRSLISLGNAHTITFNPRIVADFGEYDYEICSPSDLAEARDVMRAIQSALAMQTRILSIPDVLAQIRGKGGSGRK